jgi:phosphoglycolate phosphatase-like HAD superfamily hydrolase
VTASSVFLDVDGVLVDLQRASLEWIRLVGDVLAPALGGEPVAWGRANRGVFPRVFAEREAWYDPDPEVAERRWISLLLREECRIVGVAYPGDEEAVPLGRALDRYVCLHADCAFPGVEAVLRQVATTHDLHTATGNSSWKVEALLRQWGVRDVVGVPAGPDLAGVMKDTREYYRRVFALAGVAPESAIVVDDAAEHLQRACAVGARTVLVNAARESPDGAVIDAVIHDITDLPIALAGLKARG